MNSPQTLTAEDLTGLVVSILAKAEDQVVQIVQLGHPVLRQQALPYEGQLPEELLEELLQVMRATMYAAPGVGLAAPQIGIPLQIAVLEDLYPVTDESAALRERAPLEYLEIFNPTYRAVSDRQATFYEGCLSFDGFQAVVHRPADIIADYEDRTGAKFSREFSGWQARIIQHESDHLAGTVYIDKALTRSLVGQDELYRYPGLELEQARAELNF